MNPSASGARYRATLFLTSLLVSACGTHSSMPAAEQISPQAKLEPLLQPADIAYLGAFRVPVVGDGDTDGLRFGGQALAYDAQRNSLFMLGHPWTQKTAEISVPEPVRSADYDELPRATLLQGPVDATAGRLGQISNPAAGGYARIAGHLSVGDHLLIGAFHYYDATGSQVASHFSRPRDLLAPADTVRGPLALDSSAPPRWLGGYMAEVPATWRPIFGGSALTGIAGIPIAGNASNGPTAAVFDPDSLIDPAKEPAARLLLGYPLDHPLDALEVQNTVWNFSSELGGLAFVAGTRSVLFIGRHGIGPYCYGNGTECNDPAKAYQGTHGYPYRYMIWAYDAADLAAVARGGQTPHTPRPYGVWPLALTFERDDEHLIGGVAYDPARQRIYVSQQYGDADNAHPIVHVLSVNMPK
ncbi:MAG: hypothetical protein R3E83_11150 [Burkholderiaceae bacterium]